MKKLFILTTSLLFFGLVSIAQPSQVENKTTYFFKISGVESLQSFKSIRFYLNGMFDAIPVFDDATDEITVLSDVPIDETKFKEKMQNLGYTSIYFRIGENK